MNGEGSMMFPSGEISQVAVEQTDEHDSPHNTTNESFSEESEDQNL
jgi:hypothetical protein